MAWAIQSGRIPSEKDMWVAPWLASRSQAIGASEKEAEVAVTTVRDAASPYWFDKVQEIVESLRAAYAQQQCAKKVSWGPLGLVPSDARWC